MGRYHDAVIKTITNDATYKRLVARVSQGEAKGPLAAEGLWGSSAPIAAALLARDSGRPVIYVTAHLDHADEVRDDLENVVSAGGLLPAYESWPPAEGSSDTAAGRLQVCERLRHQDVRGQVVVVPIQALIQPVLSAAAIEQAGLEIRAGGGPPLDSLIQWCVDQGMERLEWVEAPGDFAVRGGIVDVFTHDFEDPLRIEYLDDQVDSIRRYDVSTGRSLQAVEQARISGVAAIAGASAGDRVPLFEHLPPEAILWWHEPIEITELGRTYVDRVDNERGLYPVERLFQSAAAYTQIYGIRFGGMAVAAGDDYRFDVSSIQRFEGRAAQTVATLIEMAADTRITVWCENEAEEQRLSELLADHPGGAPDTLTLERGFIHHGFDWRARGHIFIGHHELFRRARRTRRIRKAYASRPLETWLDLETGDTVVHVIHGIARFRGLAAMRKGAGQKSEEYLTLEFAGGATIHVPSSQIELVHKYIGVGGNTPALSTLGGTRWKATTEKVAEAISSFAGELLRVQAMRAALTGTTYPPDTIWQREFEGEFEYTETEDQLKVMEEIRSDLCSGRPMDRLICGDVGYGKTELAMRAAFKAMEYGRQVAVLVPTTVLAEQHHRTFSERMADYPFEIGCLSRFRSKAEQTRLIKQTSKGQVDVLIGTHRMLSKDVGFANLGLVIVDEEQRFGVEHKEHLKRFRETVDVLTLTATPIPRTLHMAMLGVRDISALATPPLDRRSIVTQVRHRDNDLVRAAIMRELNREGQVFYVHNRVHDIKEVARQLAAIVPEARCVVGHGQMSGDALEEVMMKFLDREADVLVCTTIIESGIDIPTANTIIIDDADRFGLGDLHQLRGRVGRYRHRAYCYLLLSPERTLTDIAAKRLKAIEEFSDLGAGFKIAMRDLEIRGAGNILGSEQSGHIGAVGYEMYCRLLEQAARRLKGEQDAEPPQVHVELGVTALIPRAYMRAEAARMETYRRLASCSRADEVLQVAGDLADAYGVLPEQVQNLIDLADVRVRAARWGVRSIIARSPDVVFEVTDLTLADTLFSQPAAASGTVRMPDPKTIHWRLPPAYFEGPTLLAILRKLL